MAERRATPVPTLAMELRVRRRALDNMGAVLADRAGATGGRLRVYRLGDDAFGFRFRHVRTLVRIDGELTVAERDFQFIVGVPARWPMDRENALETYVLQPADWAHPNADGGVLCMSLEGVLPEDLPRLLYGCATLQRAQLDDVFDGTAAAWMRARAGRPIDPRPLFPELPHAPHVPGAQAAPDALAVPQGPQGPEAPEARGSAVAASRNRPDSPERPARACCPDRVACALCGDPIAHVQAAQHGRGLPLVGLPRIDLPVGVFGTVLPSRIEPTFFRLAAPVGGAIDRARAWYLLTAAPQLQAGVVGWIDGPGVASLRHSADVYVPALRREIEAVAVGIRVLGEDERLAHAYLELHWHHSHHADGGNPASHAQIRSGAPTRRAIAGPEGGAPAATIPPTTPNQR